MWRCSGSLLSLVDGGKHYAMAGCQSAPVTGDTVARGVEFSAANPSKQGTMTMQRREFMRGEGLAMRRSRTLPFAIVLEGSFPPSLRRSGAWVVRLLTGSLAIGLGPPRLHMARRGRFCIRPGLGRPRKAREAGDKARAAGQSPQRREVINDVKQQRRPHNSRGATGVNNYFEVNYFNGLQCRQW